MNAVRVAKIAVNFTVASGTSRILQGVVNNNVVTNSPAEKATVIAATMAIGGVVAEKTDEYTSACIDEAVAFGKFLHTRFAKKN